MIHASMLEDKELEDMIRIMQDKLEDCYDIGQ